MEENLRWPIQYEPSASSTLKCLFFPMAFRDTEKSLGWREGDRGEGGRERPRKERVGEVEGGRCGKTKEISL